MDGERRQQRGGDQHRREYIEAGKTGRLPGSHLIELSNSRRQSVDLAVCAPVAACIYLNAKHCAAEAAQTDRAATGLAIQRSCVCECSALPRCAEH